MAKKKLLVECLCEFGQEGEQAFLGGNPEPVLVQKSRPLESVLNFDRTGHGLRRSAVFDKSIYVHFLGSYGSHQFTGMIFAGRQSTCDVIIDEIDVSKCHAFFSQKNGQWYVSDAHSKNGTSVNAEPLAENQTVELRDCDVISFGKSKFDFYYPASFCRYLKTAGALLG